MVGGRSGEGGQGSACSTPCEPGGGHGFYSKDSEEKENKKASNRF